jgi:hypothetical protein
MTNRIIRKEALGAIHMKDNPAAMGSAAGHFFGEKR